MEPICDECGNDIATVEGKCMDCIEPRRWQIELPITKPLSLNHRTHYMVRAKKTHDIRAAAGELLQLMEVPPLDHLRATVVYSPRDSRVRDPINLIPTLKPCEDALKDCGVVPDDNPQYVESLMPSILPKNEDGRGYLWFEIEEG